MAPSPNHPEPESGQRNAAPEESGTGPEAPPHKRSMRAGKRNALSGAQAEMIWPSRFLVALGERRIRSPNTRPRLQTAFLETNPIA